MEEVAAGSMMEEEARVRLRLGTASLETATSVRVKESSAGPERAKRLQGDVRGLAGSRLQCRAFTAAVGSFCAAVGTDTTDSNDRARSQSCGEGAATARDTHAAQKSLLQPAQENATHLSMVLQRELHLSQRIWEVIKVGGLLETTAAHSGHCCRRMESPSH